jgi:hypothetical protein
MNAHQCKEKEHVSWSAPYHITPEEMALLKKDPQCSICDDLTDNEKCFTILTCGHIFHMGCVSRWFSSGEGKTCPFCRQNSDFVPVDYAKVYDDYKHDHPVKSGYCAICHTKEEKSYTMLSCGHEWHYDCITKWITVRKVCPLDNRPPRFCLTARFY